MRALRDPSHLTVCTLQEDGEAVCTPALMLPATYQAMERFELLMHLGHPDMAVRHLAGRALLARFPDAADILIAQLEQPQWGLRQEEALSLLVGLQASQSQPVLLAVLLPMLQSREEARRLAVVKALRWLTDEASPFLLALGDVSWRVRLQGIFALSDMGRPEHRPALERLLREDPPQLQQVRQATQGALDRWKHRGPERSLKHVLRRSEEER